jgi:hypothetical protein
MSLMQYVVEVALIVALWLAMKRWAWLQAQGKGVRIGAFAAMVFVVVLAVNLVWPAGA